MSRFYIKVVEEKPEDGCGAAILLLIVLPGIFVVHSIYVAIVSMLPTIIMVFGIVALVSIFALLARKIGFLSAFIVYAICGAIFGSYKFYEELQEEKKQAAEAEMQAAEEERAFRIQEVKQKEKEKTTTKMDAYFNDGEEPSILPPLLLDIHKSFDASKPSRKQKPTFITVRATRIDGMLSFPIVGVKYYRKPGYFAFNGDIGQQGRCYGTVDFVSRRKQVVLSVYCLVDENTTSSAVYYTTVKKKKSQTALEREFMTDIPAHSNFGFWKSSPDSCGRRGNSISFFGRNFIHTGSLSMIADYDGINFSGNGISNDIPVQCRGEIEVIGKTRQVRYQCNSSIVNADNGSVAVSKHVQQEKAFYLCQAIPVP